MSRSDIYIKIIAVVLFLAFAVYLASWFWRSTNENIKTETVIADSVSDSVESDGLAIREEEVLYSSKQYVSIQAEEGKEISKGATLAIATDSEEDLEAANHLTELNREIHRLETLSANAAAADVTRREENIDSSIRKLASSIATGEFETADTASLDLSALLFQQDAVEKNESRLNKLKAERDSYSENDTSNSAIVESPSAGIFTRATDGFESVSPSSVETISVSKLKELLKQSPEPESDNYGKLIRSFQWTFIGLVDDDTAERLAVGDAVSLSFSRYFSEKIPSTVVNISDSDHGQRAVVFSTKYALSETMAMRHATAEIIFSESGGLRVPTDAMHVDDEGKTYVYCLTAQKVEKKEVEILNTSDSFYLVKQDSAPEALHEGDTMIVAGKDLFEGKVIEGAG